MTCTCEECGDDFEFDEDETKGPTLCPDCEAEAELDEDDEDEEDFEDDDEESDEDEG